MDKEKQFADRYEDEMCDAVPPQERVGPPIKGTVSEPKEVSDSHPTSKSGKKSTAQKLDAARNDFGGMPSTAPVAGASGKRGEKDADPMERE
jgi:hypothetical protein